MEFFSGEKEHIIVICSVDTGKGGLRAGCGSLSMCISHACVCMRYVCACPRGASFGPEDFVL